MTEWLNVFNYLEVNQNTCFLDFGETFIKCIDIFYCFRSRINLKIFNYLYSASG